MRPSWQVRRGGHAWLATTTPVPSFGHISTMGPAFRADRIAIMSKGRLRCCGTPLFLKQRFSVGYTLTVVRPPQAPLEAVTSIVSRHIADAKLQSSIAAEVAFRLPVTNNARFPGLLTDLDAATAVSGRPESGGYRAFSRTCTLVKRAFFGSCAAFAGWCNSQLQCGRHNHGGRVPARCGGGRGCSCGG